MDLGGGLRGVDMGPSAIRIAGLGKRIQALGHGFEDRGNVPVLRPEGHDPKDPKARFLSSIAHCCERLRGRVSRLLQEGRFPLVVGGDHSIAVGTVAGISSWYAQRDERIGREALASPEPQAAAISATAPRAAMARTNLRRGERS